MADGLAALPMYDRPETAAAHDALWALIRDGLRARDVAAPDALDRSVRTLARGTDRAVVLGQVCNLPLRHGLCGRLSRVGSGDYALPDTPPGHYYSHFVVRAQDDLAPDTFHGRPGARFARNEADSHSGWGAPQLWAARTGLPPFPAMPETGSHLASARAVAEGRADMAAIDAISWRAMRRFDVDLVAALRLAGETGRSPGQTFVTAAPDPRPHRAALHAAIAALPAPHRRTLGLVGLVVLTDDAYAGLDPPGRPHVA